MEWQRTRFNEAWKAIVATKRNNKMSLSHQEYLDRLTKVRRLKSAWEEGFPPNSLKKYSLLRRYDIAIKGGRERLVKPLLKEGVTLDQYPLYVTNEELFNVLHEAYIATNHGSNDVMYYRIHRRYCNVTMEAVVTYLKLRQQVEVRAISPEVEQGLLPVPPSFQSRVNGNTSVYFGFVNMYRYACNGYTCIMVHWDTNTWFTHMVPLQSMDHVHVAVSLVEIYTKVGIPNFIDAAADRPYITSIVDHIKSLWRGGDCCITIRNSDDPAALIRDWKAVQTTMDPWMDNVNFQRNWPSKLKYIQHITNQRNFSGSALPQSTISQLKFNPLV